MRKWSSLDLAISLSFSPWILCCSPQISLILCFLFVFLCYFSLMTTFPFSFHAYSFYNLEAGHPKACGCVSSIFGNFGSQYFNKHERKLVYSCYRIAAATATTSSLFQTYFISFAAKLYCHLCKSAAAFHA